MWRSYLGEVRSVNQLYPLGSVSVAGLRRRHNRAVLAGAASAAAAAVSQPVVTPDPHAGAFFDVDNTVMRGASIYHFARGLAARKLFRPRDLVKMAAGQMWFRARGAENA